MKDIVDILRAEGYGVVEGYAAVMAKMEEMANAPKEEYGKRTPGERCMYERTTEDLGSTRRPGVG